jgi:hypothetical protein
LGGVNRSLRTIFGCIAIGAAAMAPSQLSSDWNFKKFTFEAYGWRCYILIQGLGDGTFMTGTGVDCLFGANVDEWLDTEHLWLGYVERVEVLYEGQSAQIYPLSGDPVSQTAFGRFFRYDSTQAAGSGAGTQVPVKLKVKFRFVPYYAPELFDEFVDQEITVNPKAVNVATTAATTRPTPPGATPPGWQNVNLPENFTWEAVSQDSATVARNKLPLANYALYNDILHLYSTLAATQAEVDSAGNPPAVRALQLTKLLGASTAFFNSSHGQTGGFYDDADPMQLVDWASCKRTTAPQMVGQYRNLMCRFVFLYSCQCGANEFSLRDAFHHGTYQAIANTACFAFTESVFSTLKAGILANDLAYNRSDGTLALKDKLSLHVNDLLTKLASGIKAGQALAEANDAFPPRKYSHSSPNGVNYIDVLFMVNRGDNEARLHHVYRKTSESDANFLQFETWGLANKTWTAIPP